MQGRSRASKFNEKQKNRIYRETVTDIKNLDNFFSLFKKKISVNVNYFYLIQINFFQINQSYKPFLRHWLLKELDIVACYGSPSKYYVYQISFQ